MAAFRLYDKTQTWFGLTGQALPGGSVRFFTAGTTTPQVVYGERALTTNNGSTIALDSSSRLVHECWASTASAYFVEVYDADNVKQGEVSYVEVPGGTGQVIPIPSSGEYLTGDGSQFLVNGLTDRLLPDQTGHSNKILGTDGTAASWVARPADGAAGVANISTTTSSFSVGNMLVQTGSGTGTSTGGRSQTVTVTFPVAFDSTPIFVVPVVKNASLSSFGNLPTVQVTAKSATQATFQFRLSELDDSQSGFDYNAGVQYDYIAIGVKA